MIHLANPQLSDRLELLRQRIRERSNRSRVTVQFANEYRVLPLSRQVARPEIKLVYRSGISAVIDQVSIRIARIGLRPIERNHACRAIVVRDDEYRFPFFRQFLSSLDSKPRYVSPTPRAMKWIEIYRQGMVGQFPNQIRIVTNNYHCQSQY